MEKNVLTHVRDPIPAAQYVRMSDDGQQYSIDNQKTAIQKYAEDHGFVIVQTYADAGKSGVVLNRARHCANCLMMLNAAIRATRPFWFTM